MTLFRSCLFWTAASLPWLLGCGQPSDSSTPAAPLAAAKAHGQGPGFPARGASSAKHSHGAGPHGGTLAEWGGGTFHVEFVVDHERQEAVVYVFGSDEETATPVKAADDKLLLSINDPAFQVELAAAPLEGEPEGTSSRYVGRHNSLGLVRAFAGTISGKVDGTPYAADFAEEPPAGDHH